MPFTRGVEEPLLPKFRLNYSVQVSFFDFGMFSPQTFGDYTTCLQVYHSEILRSTHTYFQDSCVSQDKKRLLPYTALTRWFCTTETKYLYYATQ